MYDAIVVGSGISGGWAAMELCKKGISTLVLERGRELKHGDYPTANKEDWELPNHGQLTLEDQRKNPVQAKNTFMDQATKHLWVSEEEGPYLQTKPFHWFRGDHVGGRSLMWGRQSYRWSDIDFESNLRNGIAVDWPIRYKHLEPWYDYVEQFIGVSGSNEGLTQLPDGIFLPPMKMNILEKEISQVLAREYDDRVMTIGRVANITANHNGRTACQQRNRCIRGCPLGAYFSSQSSTLPIAYSTGKMTLVTGAVVKRLIYDEQHEAVSGVEYYDKSTDTHKIIKAKLIFLNASTIATTSILLNSKSKRFPNGLGNDSNQLGKNLMDHHYQVGAHGTTDKYQDYIDDSSRPNGIYLARFRNIPGKDYQKNYIGGFGFQGGASRVGWRRAIAEAEYGLEYKNAASEFGEWKMGIMGFGECLPYETNVVKLHPDRTDKYGMPLIDINADWGKNENEMRRDIKETAVEMLERVGLDKVEGYDEPCIIGANNHEMGTARMGSNPSTSVLNAWNQVHSAKNVFVTDGACMTSSACQNPSLTYMALTARAVDYAVSEVNKQNL